MEKLGPEDPRWIGAYRLLARLGAGGMGYVYLARSERGRTVAVKLVREELARQEEFRARFRQEVQAARRVGGYWTAPVLDADTEAPVPWVATGYVAGPSLQQVVGHDHGALPERSVRILAAGLAYALQDVHAAGIVHRDLKPSNVLVTIDGPRVIDFGIARALETVADGGLTRTGALVGSPGFMAPEQVRGDRITPACDVFCLGSVLAYAATGKLPFGAANSAVHALMFRIAQEEADLTGLPEGLRDLVRDCLRKDPAARPALGDILARTGAGDTVADGRSRDPWLPGALVAQLGRHAVRLLETENPEGTEGEGLPVPEEAAGSGGSTSGTPGSGPPDGAAAPAGPSLTKTAKTPTGAAAAAAGPGAGAGPEPGPETGPESAAEPAPAPAVTPAAEGAGEAAAAPATVPAAGWVQGPANPSSPMPLPPAPPGEAPTAHLPTVVAGRTPPQLPAQPPAYGYPQPQPPAPAYGYPQPPAQAPYGPYGTPGTPGAFGPTPPYGATAPYGPTPPYGPAPFGTPPAPEPPRRTGRSTALLVVMALVVALGAGGAVYALMQRGGTDDKGDGPARDATATAPTTPGTSTTTQPESPSPSPSASPSPSESDGPVPAGYLGTWTTTIDNAAGHSTRELTIAQGAVGDTVLSLVADGPTSGGGSYHCVFEAPLAQEPDGTGPLEIGPSTVASGPSGSCTPGAASEVSLLPDGSLQRVSSDNGAKLVYSKVN
ncbi:protein kinase [Streptomyces sp. NPDC047000]|uniref:serine/threonine-protein kinase n=1 Tax=Streptomyces sp. NPDC047000 TaxID=3155474 RepID=UPI0033FF903D